MKQYAPYRVDEISDDYGKQRAATAGAQGHDTESHTESVLEPVCGTTHDDPKNNSGCELEARSIVVKLDVVTELTPMAMP